MQPLRRPGISEPWRPMSGLTSTDETAQRRGAASYDCVTLEDCYPYHWFDMPSGETIVGSWDLRQNWRAYLGGVDFRDMRVFEAGPASGYLSLKLEAMGAEVVAFDLPPGRAPDLLPIPGTDEAKLATDVANVIDKVRNSWWFFRRAFGSRNKAIYGNIYELPKGIGRFDASFFGAILLHLANPFAAVRQAAAITDRMIVVTDLHHGDFGQRSCLEFLPHPHLNDPMGWWLISPFAVARMLTAVGFPHIEFSYHSHTHYPSLDAANGKAHPFYTVVGRREPK